MEAKAFRKWVTSEVLPNIRKTGGYVGAKVVVDVRDLLFEYHNYNGFGVKKLWHNNVAWYSIPDFLAALGSQTSSKQLAARLNSRQLMAKKFWVFGTPNPAYYGTEDALNLVAMGCRKLSKNMAFVIPFPTKTKEVLNA